MTLGLTGGMSRRTFIKSTAATLAAPALLSPSRARASGAIRVGFVTPQTGPLAFFGEPDAFILRRFAAQLAKGVGTGGENRAIEIIVKDSQSNPNRAAELTSELILEDEVSLLITAGGPDTVLPVADQAEANGTPLISSACPWQPFVLGRNSTPDKGFEWTYLFAFGLEDVIAAYIGLWSTIKTNKKIGLLFANDADGNAWGDEKFGFPPALRQAGYEVIDTGRYTPMTDDFTAQITIMKEAGVDIVAATMISPEFFSFWSQSAQQGFKPKVATVGKTLLLPSTLDAIGAAGNGLSAEVAWHPSYPFKSSNNGDTPTGVIADWEKQMNKQWTQPIGLKHALLDVALDVLARTKMLDEPASIVDAIKSTNIETLIGRVNWSESQIKNVAKTPIVGGQWRQANGKFDLTICANPTSSLIPVGGGLKPLS